MTSRATIALDLSTRAALARLWREWIASRKSALMIAFLLMAMVSATSAAYPMLIRYVFDALGAADADLIWQIPPLIISITLIKAWRCIFRCGKSRQLPWR